MCILISSRSPSTIKTATTLRTPSIQHAQPRGYKFAVQSVRFAMGIGASHGWPRDRSSVQQISVQVGSK